MTKKQNQIIARANHQINPNQSLSLAHFLERRLASIYGIDSMAIKAFDLVCEEMSAEKGFTRDNGSDFYNHCVDVANTLISFGIKDENVICAGLLHDIVEDVEGYNKITIERLFNKEVARLVMLLSKNPDLDYHIDQNLYDYLDDISNNRDASAIKTADRINNMMSLEEKTFVARYNKALETKKFYLPFFAMCRVRYPRYENLFFAAQTELQTLIFHIESFYKEIERLEGELKSKGSNNNNGGLK